MTKAVYPGSLDPITFGHIGAIEDTAKGFGEAVVAIGVNPAKNYLFSLAEREELARQATAGIPGVTVTSFSGLLVHFLVRNDLKVVVRGVRNGQDLDDNLLQETIGWQQTLAKDLKAFYVPARPGQSFTSSTALKAVLKEQGDVTHLAPLCTIHATQARLLSQYFYGVTGVSGAGKSSVCRAFVEIARERNIPLIHVDLDKIGHAILSSEQDPLYEKIRQQIRDAFGAQVLDEQGFIVRKKLGEIVFGNPDKLKILNSIMHEPVFFRMNDMLRGRKGVFLIDAALLAETDKISLVNNQMMLVDSDRDELTKRLAQRDGLTPAQVERRLSSAFTAAAKIDTIEKNIAKAHYGSLQRIDNGMGQTAAQLEQAFDAMLEQVDIFGEMRIAGFLKGLGVADTAAAYTGLRKLYSGDERFHHTLAHVVGGLNQLPTLSGLITDKAAFQLAWLFCNAVHDVHAADNRENSAALLKKMGGAWGVDADVIARAQALVLAAQPGRVAADAAMDVKLLADLDIAVIGGDKAAYSRYQDNLRREYNAVSSKDWMERQRSLLEKLPEQGFQSDYFRQKLGKAAHRNIRATLSKRPAPRPG